MQVVRVLRTEILMQLLIGISAILATYLTIWAARMCGLPITESPVIVWMIWALFGELLRMDHELWLRHRQLNEKLDQLLRK